MSNEMFDVIKCDLEQLEEKLLAAVGSSEAIVQEIGTHLVTAGGKRLRPALCLLAAHGGPRFELGRILPLAAALELIHTASLVHDDVIDKAGTRRGIPTANAKWGDKISILGGDYIFAQAFRLVAAEEYGGYVYHRLAELVGNLSTGEIIQDRQVYTASRDMEDYYSRIRKKTADFLEICCDLGGVISGLPREEAKRLAEYGHCIGMAFQITDDILDIEQTEETVGKPVGNDIRQGIVTLPVIFALRESPDREELEAIVTDAAMTGEMVERAIAIVRDSGGIGYAKDRAEAYLAQAREALPDTLPEEVKNAFLMVADFIAERDF